MKRAALDRALEYLSSWLAYRVPRVEVPGMSVAVSHAGRVIFEEAYGYADVEQRRLLRRSDVFRVASHSKSFTATAVLQLAERGRLDLHAPLAARLSWLAQHPDRRFSKLTALQLLSHGAGVVRDGLDCDHWQLLRPFPDDEQLRRMVLEADLVTDTGVALKYSNIGYSLLGSLIESVAGCSYHEYLADHVVHELGLSGTGPEWRERPHLHAVTGYTRREPEVGRQAIPPVDTHALAPATGFYSTAGELCRFFSALFVGSHQLLSDDTKREMQRVHWHAERPGGETHEDYGLGLQLERVGERRTFGHSGGFPGQSTRTYADRADRLVVSVLTNCIDGPASDVARGILAVIDYFQRLPGGRTPPGRAGLEGRYIGLWSVLDLVASGPKLAVGHPDSWQPLAETDLLEPAGEDCFRVARTSSYGSAGEAVVFHRRRGRVERVVFAGATIWPAASWPAARQQLLNGA